MINFEEYAKLYHPNVVNETERKHLMVEYNECVELINRLDKDKDYSSHELISILFKNKIDSQTTFYRKRRGLTRIATIQGFDFRLIHRINQISFNDIYDDSDFPNEFWGSLDELYSEINKIQKLDIAIDRTGSRAAIGLLWSGLTFSEITRIKDSDLHLDRKIISSEGKDIRVDDRTIRAIKDYILWRKGGGEYLFTGSNGVKAHRTTVNKMISGMNGYTKKSFISKNITYSGKFYRIYHNIEPNELKGVDIQTKYELWVKNFGEEE